MCDLFIFVLLSCVEVVPVYTAQAPSNVKPTMDVFISAGDNYWVNYALAVDSPASIRDSVANVGGCLSASNGCIGAGSRMKPGLTMRISGNKTSSTTTFMIGSDI